LMLSDVSKRLKEKDIKMEVTDAAKDFLGEKGYDETYGARPLRRVIQTMLEDPFSEGILGGRFPPGETVVVDREGDEIVLRSVPVVKAALGEKQQVV
ncbi:MAG: NDP-hexose 4-ketoreductase, partial [Dehalococcoidia bacterium]|nr:NDP-hexose 4-ketoreductase [Dehalococcoidia bacterium]